MTELSAEQIKGRIRNVAKEKNADAIVLLRIFMMERFLERLSLSKYKNNFIVKGGLLISSLVGVSLRSTMDIDMSIKGISLTKEKVKNILNEICCISLDDIRIQITNIDNIMNDANYIGIRASLEASIDNIKVPFSIDISTGDIVTPKEIDYEYLLMLENRKIDLYTYSIETILSEKLQTIISRGILNTRLRDYYDIYILMLEQENNIDIEIFKDAFNKTCVNRNTVFKRDYIQNVINEINSDARIRKLWNRYQTKYDYATDIEFDDCLMSIKKLVYSL